MAGCRLTHLAELARELSSERLHVLLLCAEELLEEQQHAVPPAGG